MPTDDTKSKKNPLISPFSFYINIIHFTILALTTRYFFTLLLEFIFLFSINLSFSKNVKLIRIKDLISLIPLFIFIVSINSFRGGGIIIIELWHFNIIKQGIFRGFYYSGVIFLLFIMSRLLILLFSENEIISSVSFISRKKENKMDESDPVQLLIVIVYVIRILKVAYEEMKIFFKKNGGPIKVRFLKFFYIVFNKAESEYHHLERINVSKISLKPIDPIVILVQVMITILVLKLKLWSI